MELWQTCDNLKTENLEVNTHSFNPFPSLTLQSAWNLNVPSPSKRSKAFLV